MKRKVAYAITDSNITVNFDGQTHIVSRMDALADRLIAAVREDRRDEIPDLVSAAQRIERFGQGDFKVDNGLVLVNGIAVPEYLSKKILKFQAEKLPHQPLVKFAENLQKNPSYRAVNELFQFLEKNDHPITDNGNFIAYKRVRSDFKDIHSGTFDNSVGQTVEMPRNQVNEDSAQTCSAGLHVANWNYANTQFASSNPATDVMLEIEVNPSDVVSIPADYNQSKMRVCKYVVLGLMDKEHSTETHLRYTASPSLNYDEAEFDDDEDEDDSCQGCGGYTEAGYDLCLACEEEADEEDEYPWDKETI